MSARKEKIKSGFRKIGNTLQKINLPRMIDEMEKDQELADQLETVNKEIQEESDRKEIVRQATEQCIQEIKSHLTQFLQDNKYATYEDWIMDLHPENVQAGLLLQDMILIDPRFYVIDSDHRLLWNQMVPDRQVGPQTIKQQNDRQKKDLLDSYS